MEKGGARHHGPAGRDQGNRQSDQGLGGIEAQLERKAELNPPRHPESPSCVCSGGHDDAANLEVRRWGKPPVFDFQPLDHVDLGTALGILDMDRAAKITGARFSLLAGAGALMERALINFMLDVHTQDHGYRRSLPPFMANSASLFGTGNLPKFAQDLFKLEGTDYLPDSDGGGSGDQHLQGRDAGRIDACRKFVAYTPCFRSEAGSYGKDTRGLIRQHQFDKVELVKFAEPNFLRRMEGLTRDAENILERLGLHYRTVVLCTGDMGFSSAKTYDIEVWLPSQNRFREISSCSNFEAFQARRASIRYKSAGWQAELRPHPERIGTGDRQDLAGDPGELSAEGRLGHHPGSAAHLYGRYGSHCQTVMDGPPRIGFGGSASRTRRAQARESVRSLRRSEPRAQASRRGSDRYLIFETTTTQSRMRAPCASGSVGIDSARSREISIVEPRRISRSLPRLRRRWPARLLRLLRLRSQRLCRRRPDLRCRRPPGPESKRARRLRPWSPPL